MSGFVAWLRSVTDSFFSSLAAKRGVLILALLVQGTCAGVYLYLEHNWIEARVVQSLKNVSSMHLRSFDQLEITLNYQLSSIGEAMGLLGMDLPRKQALLQKELKQAWLDTVIVLDAAGNIVTFATDVPLSAALPPSVLAASSYKNWSRYRAFMDSGAETASFFVSRPQIPELRGGGIVMYRRIKSTQGDLLGSVVGFTSLHSLSNLLNADVARGFDLGKNGILNFIDRRTNKILYRYMYSNDPAEVYSGGLIPLGGASFQDSRYGAEVKFYRSPVDGLERLAVLAPMHNDQWLQLVGASKDEYLFNWRIQVIFSVFAFICLCILQWLLVTFIHQNRAQRALLDLVLDTMDAYVYFKTSERRFVYANAKTADLFGLPAEQIIGRLDREILPPKVADDFWVMDRQVFASGTKQSATEVVTTPDGKKHYYASIKVPVQLPDQPLALIGFSTDVTELHEQTIAREAAEKELVAHNHSLRLNNLVLDKLAQNATLSEVLNAMVCIIDDYRVGVSGAVYLVADNGKELIGCVAPHLPEAWFGATARVPIDDMNGSCAIAVSRGETVIVEDIASDSSYRGSTREAILAFGLRAAWTQPIKNNEGTILGVFALYQRQPAAPDIHDLALLVDYSKLAQLVIERSRLAEALAESQALYRLVAENSNDVIWVVQYPSMRYSYISPSVEWLRGWTQEETFNVPLLQSMPPDSVYLWNEVVAEHLRRIDEGDLTGRFIGIELSVWHKDGHRVPVEVVANIMLDNACRPTHIVGSSRDITRRKVAEDTIRKMAFYDQLTDLPNRRMLEDQLAKMLALANREQRTLSLLFIDLDRFKAVNDQHGHEAGDWLLKQVAVRMCSVLRASDTASRIGGDEFIILLPDAHKTVEALQVAKKIRRILEKPFVMDNGVELDISSSIGVVMYPDQADNMRDLFHFGDEAMYRAKKGGRNAVEVFAPLAQSDERSRENLQGRDAQQLTGDEEH
ncbi:diguanylate cyclase [Pseudomonas tussilaginis]|uniref:diguanylate cyclase n=1 Tax=unclassified Pseudomonas TaxID=196821 RepID=UPI000C6DC5DE|nr:MULTISPECIES: diguanylate cyclase [unclassified Pseudomonas]QYX47740.1 diguanylate cyclase [Pseudomonas sp. S11A 273]